MISNNYKKLCYWVIYTDFIKSENKCNQIKKNVNNVDLKNWIYIWYYGVPNMRWAN